MSHDYAHPPLTHRPLRTMFLAMVVRIHSGFLKTLTEVPGSAALMDKTRGKEGKTAFYGPITLIQE